MCTRNTNESIYISKLKKIEQNKKNTYLRTTSKHRQDLVKSEIGVDPDFKAKILQHDSEPLAVLVGAVTFVFGLKFHVVEDEGDASSWVPHVVLLAVHFHHRRLHIERRLARRLRRRLTSRKICVFIIKYIPRNLEIITSTICDMDSHL
jgi:hypothetical protein